VALSIGETLAGQILTLDTLTMECRKRSIRRNPECPVCGTTKDT
jgi:molybdopterin/thiamine biosynthesis adenylyltransferase